MQITRNRVTPIKAFLGWIPSGKEGTIATLKVMGQMVKAGKKNPVIRHLAMSLVKNNGQKDWAGEVRDIHAFVRDSVRYVKDVRGIETLQTPEKTLELGQGDCDDKSVLLASLLESIGHPTRFVAIAFEPDNYVHVFVETKIGPHWIAAETTEPVELGWYPPRKHYRLVFFN